ncbi:hypothetical protein AVEN_192968-1, partial [Araneus ventricosus]
PDKVQDLPLDCHMIYSPEVLSDRRHHDLSSGKLEMISVFGELYKRVELVRIAEIIVKEMMTSLVLGRYHVHFVAIKAGFN